MRPDLPAVACVLGPGGIGKSNLCLSALHAKSVKEKFERRRAFVRCDAATGRESLVKFIAEEIGVEIGPNLEDRVFYELERGPAVVILDNFESPWEREQGEVEAFLSLLAGIEHLALVVGVRGQQRPGGIAYREAIEIETLSPEHAAEVFLNVAGRKFATDPALQPLLREMDYLPLAVELLAYRAQTETSLSRLEKSWREKKSEILKRADAKDRQTNLAVSVELSFESPRMTEDAKKLASLLGVLPNGIADEDLPAVLGNEGDEAARVLRSVGLAFSEDERIRVLAPIRSYLAEFHFPDDSTALKPAMVHFVEMGTNLGGRAGRPGGAEAVQKVVADYENIVAMINAVLKTDDWKSGADAACRMAEFIRFTGFGNGEILEGAENTAREHGDVLGQANCILSLGDIALMRSDHEEARAWYAEARALYERVGDVLGQANCIKRFGDISLSYSAHTEARSYYEKAKVLYGQIGDVLGQANCKLGLGDIELDRADSETARTNYGKAMQLYEQVGDMLGQANCIQRLGDIALYYHLNYSEALMRYEQAQPLFEKIGALRGQTNCVFRLGNIALLYLDFAAARKQFKQAQTLYKHIGDIIGQANCIQGLGRIALGEENIGEAKKRYFEALSLYERIPEPYSVGLTHELLAQISEGGERAAHIAAAREAWESINRPDLVAKLDKP